MNYEQEKRMHMSFCGSYCHKCDWHTGKIRKTFRSALDMLEDYKFTRLLEGKSDRENLRLGLSLLSDSGICSGCKAEIARGPEQDRCKIRQCSSEKGSQLCSECEVFPCHLLKNNAGVTKWGCIENLEEIKKIGFERWIDKQWRSVRE